MRARMHQRASARCWSSDARALATDSAASLAGLRALIRQRSSSLHVQARTTRNAVVRLPASARRWDALVLVMRSAAATLAASTQQR